MTVSKAASVWRAMSFRLIGPSSDQGAPSREDRPPQPDRDSTDRAAHTKLSPWHIASGMLPSPWPEHRTPWPWARLRETATVVGGSLAKSYQNTSATVPGR